MRTDPIEQQTKRLLETQIFPQEGIESLVLFLRVFDDKKIAPIRRGGDTNDPASESPKSRRDPSDGGAGGKRKGRIMCLSVRNNGKVRLHKVKPSTSGYQIAKSWNLDDIKTVQNIDAYQFVINLNKPYILAVEEAKKKTEFLYVLFKLCQKYLKKMPKFIGLTLEALQRDIKQYDDGEDGESAEDDEDNDNAALKLNKSFMNLEEALLRVQEEQEELSIDEVLADFEWKAGADASALETRLNNELAALEAANIHAIIQAEEQSLAVINRLEKTAGELDNIENWLTLYSNELTDMGRDIGAIEAQNRDLQIETNNQKILLTELAKFMAALDLPEEVFEVLRKETFETLNGVRRLETAASQLQKSLQTKVEEGLQQMQAVTERMSLFAGTVDSFSERFIQFITSLIDMQIDLALREDKSFGNNKLESYPHIQQQLLQYRNLVAWLKEMDPRRFNSIQLILAQSLNKLLRRDFKKFFDYLRSVLTNRKAGDDSNAFVFVQPGKYPALVPIGSSQSKSNNSNLSVSNVITAATKGHRKAISDTSSIISGGGADEFPVVKPTKGHRRNQLSESIPLSAAATGNPGISSGEQLGSFECFKRVISAIAPIVIQEQNFAIDFFVFTGSKPLDYPLYKLVDEFNVRREMPKDIKTSKKLEEILTNQFDGLLGEFLAFIELYLRSDSTSVVGYLGCIEVARRENSSPPLPFFLVLLESVNEKLSVVFERFIEEQLRAIDETKVTSKKRSGILSFVKTFPNFLQKTEEYMRSFDASSIPETRKLINGAYEKIIKMMFAVLEVFAQETLQSNPDDKEQLNAHILMLENMHHLHREVRGQKVPSMDVHVKAAKAQYDLHLNAYVHTVVRRSLGKLIDFFEGVEDLLKTKSAEEVGFHLSYNRQSLKKVVALYPGKEVRKALETLYKRVVKHYCDEEGLLQVVWHGIQEEFIRLHRHYESLIQKCYPNIDTRLAFTIDDLCSYFSEIAKIMH